MSKALKNRIKTCIASLVLFAAVMFFAADAFCEVLIKTNGPAGLTKSSIESTPAPSTTLTADGGSFESRRLKVRLVYDADDFKDVKGKSWSYTVNYTFSAPSLDPAVQHNLVISKNATSDIYEVVNIHPLVNDNTVVLNVVGFSAGANPVDVPDNIRLVFSMETVTFSRFMPEGSSSSGFKPVFEADTSQTRAHWRAVTGAEEYDLEWVFIDASAGAVLSNYSKAFTFKDPVRVTTNASEYSIDLNYPAGELYYRVRAVGRFSDDTSRPRYGEWSGIEHFDITPSALELNKNWQLVTIYSENAKRKKNIKYFDGLFMERQAITSLASAESTLVSEVKYDHERRPVLSILPAPRLETDLRYHLKFNRSNNATDDYFGAANFNEGTIEPLSLAYGAGKYFSSNNTAVINRDYLPDAGGYPYSLLEYLRDGTGRVRKGSGIGQTLMLGGGHDTVSIYGGANSFGLRRLFGSNVGPSRQYKRNLVFTPNRQGRAMYVDLQGRTIATALVGNNSGNLKAIPKPASSTQIRPLNENNTLDSDLRISRSVNTITNMVVNGAYNFYYKFTGVDYQVDPNQEQEQDGFPMLCASCKYELTVTIEDSYGNLVRIKPGTDSSCLTTSANSEELFTHIFENIPPPVCDGNTSRTTAQTYSTVKFCATFEHIGEEGKYVVTKTLRLMEGSVKDSIEDIESSPGYIALKQSYEEEPRIDESKCDDTCEEHGRSFLTKANEESIEENGGPLYATEEEFEQALENYVESCEGGTIDYAIQNNANKECKNLFLALQSDVSPGGRLFEDEVWFNANVYDALLNELQIEYEGTSDELSDELTENWKSDYAKYLARHKHPERCHLTHCPALKKSRIYDARMTVVDTYNDALSAGYLNPLGMAQSSSGPPVGPLGLLKLDPYFQQAQPGFFSQDGYGYPYASIIKSKLQNYFNHPSRGQISLWQFVALPELYSTDSSGSTVVPQDVQWRMFRSIYQGLKQQIHVTVMEVGKSCKYDDDEYANVKRPATHDDLDANLGGAAGEAVVNDILVEVDEGIDTYCGQYLCPTKAEMWTYKLEQSCDLTSDILDELKVLLEEYCGRECGVENPLGLLTNKAIAEGDPTLTDIQALLGATCSISEVAVDDPYIKEEYCETECCVEKPAPLCMTMLVDLFGKALPVEFGKRLDLSMKFATDTGKSCEFLNNSKVRVGKKSASTITVEYGSKACDIIFYDKEGLLIHPVDIRDIGSAFYSHTYPKAIPAEMALKFKRLAVKARVSDKKTTLYLFADCSVQSPGKGEMECSIKPPVICEDKDIQLDPQLVEEWVDKYGADTSSFVCEDGKKKTDGEDRESDHSKVVDDDNNRKQEVCVFCVVDAINLLEKLSNGVIKESVNLSDSKCFEQLDVDGTRDTVTFKQFWPEKKACKMFFFNEYGDLIPLIYINNYGDIRVVSQLPQALEEMANPDLDFTGYGVVVTFKDGQPHTLYIYSDCNNGESKQCDDTSVKEQCVESPSPVTQECRYCAWELFELLKYPHFDGKFKCFGKIAYSAKGVELVGNEKSGYKSCSVQFYDEQGSPVIVGNATVFANPLNVDSLPTGLPLTLPNGLIFTGLSVHVSINNINKKVYLYSNCDLGKAKACKDTEAESPGNCGEGRTGKAEGCHTLKRPGDCISEVVDTLDDHRFEAWNRWYELQYSACFKSARVSSDLAAFIPLPENNKWNEDSCGFQLYLPSGQILNYVMVIDIIGGPLLIEALPESFTMRGSPVGSYTGFAIKVIARKPVIPLPPASPFYESFVYIFSNCDMETENDCYNYPTGLDISIPDSPDLHDQCVEDLLEEEKYKKRIRFESKAGEYEVTSREVQYQKCFDYPFKENFRYEPPGNSEYHYTLSLYDQAQNLVATVPPAGVEPFSGALTESLINKFANRTNAPSDEPQHRMLSKFKYNSLNQVLYQETPDAGEKKLWYNKATQMRAWQDDRLKTSDTFGYMKYDEQGRVIESGLVTLANPDKIEESIEAADFPKRSDHVLTEIMSTLYDTTSDSGRTYLRQPDLSTFKRENLRGGISMVQVEPSEGVVTSAKYYNYEPHGNVRGLLNFIDGLGEKRIEYDFDLISGNIIAVHYQQNDVDEFHQRYEYDGANRLTLVYSSRNGELWDRDAAYTYYKHNNSIARMEIGDGGIQGVDYSMTLQGWLKGVNSDTLDPSRDPGKDGFAGSTNSHIARDAVGFSLGYFPGDYTPIGGNAFEADTTGSGLLIKARGLYDGNIIRMVVANKVFMGAGKDIQGNAYQYDQLNRLDSATVFSNIDTVNNSWQAAPGATGDPFGSSYEYDSNGNITTIERFAKDPLVMVATPDHSMDDLTYNYQKDGSGKLLNNRLRHIDDTVAASKFVGLDIDDQSADNYGYDEIGQLIKDDAEGISEITWLAGGKVRFIKQTDGDDNLEFGYDAMGDRVIKSAEGIVAADGSSVDTRWYYVRDAGGKILATYKRTLTYDGLGNVVDDLVLSDLALGAAKRLGIWQLDEPMVTGPPAPVLTYEKVRGQKRFELGSHTGNVLGVVTDRKLGEDSDTDGTVDYYDPTVLSAVDYYPFGMAMPERSDTDPTYRYGFQGMEKDNELKGEGKSYITQARLFDPRVGRWMSTDPVFNASSSSYVGLGNNPIILVDIFGTEEEPIPPAPPGIKYEGNASYTDDDYVKHPFDPSGPPIPKMGSEAEKRERKQQKQSTVSAITKEEASWARRQPPIDPDDLAGPSGLSKNDIKAFVNNLRMIGSNPISSLLYLRHCGNGLCSNSEVAFWASAGTSIWALVGLTSAASMGVQKPSKSVPSYNDRFNLEQKTNPTKAATDVTTPSGKGIVDSSEVSAQTIRATQRHDRMELKHSKEIFTERKR